MEFLLIYDLDCIIIFFPPQGLSRHFKDVLSDPKYPEWQFEKPNHVCTPRVEGLVVFHAMYLELEQYLTQVLFVELSWQFDVGKRTLSLESDWPQWGAWLCHTGWPGTSYFTSQSFIFLVCKVLSGLTEIACTKHGTWEGLVAA